MTWKRQRQCCGWIIGAQPFLVQKAVEAAQRGRAARDGGGRQLDPGAAKRRQLLMTSLADVEEHRRGRFQVVTIGQQRVARRTRFRRQHVEEAVDQRAVGRDHVRASASAAIIRAG